MAEAIFTITGMTCVHCVSSVTEEVSKIDGVRHVDIDLNTGRVVVTSDSPVPADVINGAVTEAGYALVP